VILADEKRGAAVVTEADLAKPEGPQVIVVTTQGVQRQDSKGFSYKLKPGVSARAVEAHRLHLRAGPEDKVLLVSDRGRAWWGGVGRLPRTATFAELGLEKGEQVVGGGVPVKDTFLTLGTRQGRVKRLKAEDAQTGAEASWSTIIGLGGEDDRVLFAGLGGADAQVMFWTAARAVRFATGEVNPQATPSARGVAGISLKAGDPLLGGALIDSKAKLGLVLASQAGFVKRVSLAEFPVQGRGGQGVTLLNPNKTTGPVVAVAVGPAEGAVDLLTADGRRQRLEQVPAASRAQRGGKVAELEAVAEVRVF